jgi:hypothetical protein
VFVYFIISYHLFNHFIAANKPITAFLGFVGILTSPGGFASLKGIL